MVENSGQRMALGVQRILSLKSKSSLEAVKSNVSGIIDSVKTTSHVVKKTIQKGARRFHEKISNLRENSASKEAQKKESDSTSRAKEPSSGNESSVDLKPTSSTLSSNGNDPLLEEVQEDADVVQTDQLQESPSSSNDEHVPTISEISRDHRSAKELAAATEKVEKILLKDREELQRKKPK